MLKTHIGELAGLGVSVCWTFSALFFEKAGHRIGSLSVNFIRLLLAVVFLSVAAWFTHGLLLPTDATPYQWFWLGMSGFFGLFVGDMLLFHSYLIIGSRTSALIMSLVPMITALIGWVFLGEILSPQSILAIVVSVAGIFIAIVNRKMSFNIPLKGFLLAFGGAMGQAVGLIMSKKGMGSYDPVAATQIRVFFGLASFTLLISIIRQWGKIGNAFNNKAGIRSVTIGSVFGPFIGVSLALFSLQKTQTGIASTLMALVPIFIILPSAIMFNEKIRPQQIIGAIISIIGCSLFFL